MCSTNGLDFCGFAHYDNDNSPVKTFDELRAFLACYAAHPNRALLVCAFVGARSVSQEGCLTNNNTILDEDALLNKYDGQHQHSDWVWCAFQQHHRGRKHGPPLDSAL